MRAPIQRRVFNVIAAVEAVRDAHPQLAHGAKPRGVWQTLAREGIEVRRGRIRRKGRSSKFDGDAVITLRSDLSPREAWKWALHEYGHLRMHFPEHGEFEKHVTPCRVGDPREDEAHLFAALLVLGPDATVEHPTAAAIVARMTARDMMAKRPPQMNLELPEPAPVFRPRPADNKLLEAAYEDALAHHRRTRGKARTKIFRDPLQENEDFSRIEYGDGRTPTRFIDIAGRRWRIKNFAAVTVANRREWILVRDFMSPDITHRLFLGSTGDRRIYEFKDRREARAYRVRHLDRQLAQAKPIARLATGVVALLRRGSRT